jgi:hypothetical protein
LPELAVDRVDARRAYPQAHLAGARLGDVYLGLVQLALMGDGQRLGYDGLVVAVEVTGSVSRVLS